MGTITWVRDEHRGAHPVTGRLTLSIGAELILAARIALGTGQPSRDPLFDAVPKRHTNRRPYREVPVAPELLRGLGDLVSDPDLRFAFIADDDARRELGAIIVAATDRIIADPEMSLDSFRWILGAFYRPVG